MQFCELINNNRTGEKLVSDLIFFFANSLLLKDLSAPTFAISDIYHFNSALKLPFHETDDGLSSHQEIVLKPICPYFTL